jgi:hypothetical protein
MSACVTKNGGKSASGQEKPANGENQTASSGAAAGTAKGAATEAWREEDNAFTAWYSEDEPEDRGGIDIDSETMRVGKTKDGKDIFAMLRLPLAGTWLASEVNEAKLMLKVKEGEPPAALRACFVSKPWSFSTTTRKEARAMVEDKTMKSVPVKKEEGGWVSVQVTDFVKAMLGSEHANYGLALFGESDGETAVFVSGWTENADDSPYLRVSGEILDRKLDYGKFGYTESPLSGADIEDGGNCMSYALRDLDMILIDDLAADFKKINSAYEKGGADEVAEYMAEQVRSYIDAHKEDLKISGFRRIDDFDSEIDAANEYRIALRVGCKVWDGETDLGGDGNFDFHFRAQLNDGQWAQKFPLDPSEIVPNSGPGISPATYPWDSARMWSDKAQDYYDSKVIYFAVQKDTDEFTKHKEKRPYKREIL